jgi:ferredoxin
MTTALIVGSGAAAAGAALALSHREHLAITVIDIGLQLETDRQQLVSLLASAAPDEWDTGIKEYISKQPVSSGARGVPEKRVFGSNYPFRDMGQLAGLTGAEGANISVISSAYGGFSNVWGSQIMPFTDKTFESWPIKASEMRSHYEAILNHIPFAGEEDDLATSFPLLRPPNALPPMAPRSQKILDAYAKHRSKLSGRGVTVGKARLAFKPSECVRCGLCMTGCPYGLIYSAAQTFNELRRAGRIKFHGGLMALKITEEAERVTVVAKEVSTGQLQHFEADHVYVACGAVGTTRLVANSQGMYDVDIPMQESRQFILPFLSMGATEDPRNKDDFTLNQFNMIVATDGGSLDVSTLHFYAFNNAFMDGLPSVLRTRAAEPLRAQVLRRLSVAFGYLPSWNSPLLRIRVGAKRNDLDFPELHISSEGAPPGQATMMSGILRKLTGAARSLDLYPVIPMLKLSPAAKSYHWGASFPHMDGGSAQFRSDNLGRVGSWKRTHLIDASVFPTVPATTYGLTVMANAHRIASESTGLTSWLTNHRLPP